MQFALFGITVLVRQIMEFFVSVPPTGVLFVDASTFLHAAIFYGTFFSALAFCLGHFTGWKYREATQQVFALSPLLLLAPLIDLFFFGRYGVSMGYHFVYPAEFVEHFFSFFGPMTRAGITFGMRIQVLGVIFLFGMWVYKVKRSIGHAILAMLATYGLIYVMASAPSFVGWFEFIREGGASMRIDEAVFLAINQNVARAHAWGAGDSITILRFNMVMAEVWFIVLTSLLSWKCKKAIRTSYTKSRAVRAGLYVGLCVAGAVLAPSYIQNVDIEFTAVTVITAIAATVTVICAWTYAFVVNDIYDLAADKLVHRERALPRGALSTEHMYAVAKNAALLAILGSIALSPAAFGAIVCFLVCATVYSVPPVRARQFFMAPQLIMAVASLAIFYLGFTLVAKDPISGDVIKIMASLGLLLFGFWFFKDIPDMEGDKQAGYDTVMTRFGEVKGPRVAYGIFIASSFVVMVLTHSVHLAGVWAGCHILMYGLIEKGLLGEKMMPVALLPYVITLLVLGV